MDEIRQHIPEYFSYVKNDLWTAIYKTNREAGYIVELIQKHALFNEYNLIINGSLKDSMWYYSYFSWIKETFPKYVAVIIHVKTMWEKILERNLLRAEAQGRFIPLATLRESMECSKLSFEKIKEHPIIKGSLEITNIVENFNPVKENLESITQLLHLLSP